LSEPRPELSIVITSFNARETIGACLDSLRRQRTARVFEVVLVDSSTDGTAPFVQANYPDVTVMVSPVRLYAGAARNLGLTRARARVIAFLDADCYVGADWVDCVCEAHERGDLLVGGCVDNAPSRSLVSWAYYFCEFSLWLPVARSRHVSEMAGCCLSLKRSAFDRYGPFLEATYSSDTAFQWKLRRDGHQVWVTPSITVFHRSPSGLRRFLAHTVEHRRDFARVKCRERRLAGTARLGEILLLTVTPLLLMGATMLRLRVCPRYIPRFLAVSPLVLLGFLARSWGEFTGYLHPNPERP
jgi:GT2 family glycosyltransferase